jgi:hypothetical protein
LFAADDALRRARGSGTVLRRDVCPGMAERASSPFTSMRLYRQNPPAHEAAVVRLEIWRAIADADGRSGAMGRRLPPTRPFLSVNYVSIDVNVRHSVGHFVIFLFVFIHIAASFVIFNISSGGLLPARDFLLI